MCDPKNTTAVNGYMNQDSHTVSWCILFFSVSKRRLDKGYFRDLYECKTGSLFVVDGGVQSEQGSFISSFIEFGVVVLEEKC